MVAEAGAAVPQTPGAPYSRRLVYGLGRYGTIGALALMVVGFSVIAPESFPTLSNFTNIIDQVALIAIISTGLTVILAAGEFDLSIGYVSSFANVFVIGLMANQHAPIWAAIAVTIAAGSLVGLANGLIVTKLGVNALITTLGSGTVVVGLNYAYSGSIPFALESNSGFANISLGTVLGIPNPIIFMVLYLAAFHILMNYTEIGQQVQAVGGNPEAARLSGIRIDRVKTTAFILSGVSAAVTGILLASRIESAQITAGDGYLLEAFAAAFLGSAVLRSGEFHVLGTFIGVLTVGVGYNGLAIIGVPPFVQFVFNGGLLVGAVALSSVARRSAPAR